VSPGIWTSRKRTSGRFASISRSAVTPSCTGSNSVSSGQRRVRSSRSSAARIGSSSTIKAVGIAGGLLDEGKLELVRGGGVAERRDGERRRAAVQLGDALADPFDSRCDRGGAGGFGQ